MYKQFASTKKELNLVKLFWQMQAVHRLFLLYLMHIKPVKFVPINACVITRQWKFSYTEVVPSQIIPLKVRLFHTLQEATFLQREENEFAP